MNPHQNININISYNLASDKPLKTLPAKKIHKQHKTHTQHHPHCDLIEIKMNKKNNENNHRKSNEPRSLNDTKKTKKKAPAPVRNTLTPELFAQRRIKTEGPSVTDQELISAFKKDSKSKAHNRSVQQPLGKMSQPSKKSNSQAKSQKFTKVGHITSCTVPNWKKIPFDLTENLSSQPTLPKKRRVHSHSTFIKNDKIVSKLLNVSMLASELGGSQPITSERKANSSAQSKCLKEYMSSMDMRIISSMQKDVPKQIQILKDIPFFADHKDHSTDIVRNMMKRNKISLQELTRKVRIIQRKWRAIRKKDVINTYKRLFQHIALTFKKAQKISDISEIYHSPVEVDHLAREKYVIDSEDPSSIKLDLEILKNNSNSMDKDSFEHIQNMKWIQQSQEPVNQFNQTLQGGLNLKKYRELVDSELEKPPKSQKTKAKQIYQEQVQQWNSINKQITNIMNYKGQLDSQILLDQLIKQSRNNQYWIDTEFQAEEKEFKKKERICQQEKREDKEDEDESDLLLETILEKEKEKEDKAKVKSQDSLQEQEQEGYDKQKYEDPVPSENLEQQKETPKIEPTTLLSRDDEHISFPESQESSADKNLDQRWIVQHQVMQDNVVRNYLDCGLGDFGIDINSKILQLPEEKKAEIEAQIQENENQDYNSSDEAIGIKFEEANLAIIKRSLEDRPDLEPQHRRKIDNGQVHATIEHIVRFLISQFATDISVILKKSSGEAPAPEKKPIQRIPGISTHFNSIKDYLTQFISYISKEPTLIKVVDTINKDIGPSSLEILTYLRPQPEDGSFPMSMEPQQQSFEDEEGLFVVPADMFEQFELQLEQQYKKQNSKEMGPRLRAYLSFWHRCIFESYNECLDYQRPYGVQGKPYEWTTNTKVFRPITQKTIIEHLHKAETRLLDLTSLVGGLIFQKADSPFSGADLSEEQKHMMNEERLSRILATELLESEQSWINYNDEMAELLVELSRSIEDKLFFDHATELKKIYRRRKIIAGESSKEEYVIFNVDQL